MSYTPQPGTLPARITAWLATQPAGSMFATAVIAETLGVGAAQVHDSLAYPAKKGAFVVERRGNLKFWGLPGTRRPSLDDDAEPDDDPPVQRIVPASSAAAPAAEPSPALKRRPRGPDKKPRKAATACGVTSTAAPLARSFAATEPAFPDWQLRLNELGEIAKPPRFALWSDGALTVERAGQRLEFNTEETRALCGYLDSVLRGGVEA